MAEPAESHCVNGKKGQEHIPNEVGGVAVDHARRHELRSRLSVRRLAFVRVVKLDVDVVIHVIFVTLVEVLDLDDVWPGITRDEL
jgi:hypothetical protein